MVYGSEDALVSTAGNHNMFSRSLLCALFVLAGVNHFRVPQTYMQIMPPALPAPLALVYISGLAEIIGGLGVMDSKTRPWAGVWLLLLLIAVFPANIYSIFSGLEIEGKRVPQWILWARLPFQPLMMWWVWKSTLRDFHWKETKK
jgi:uncharacterized membrane protein